MEAIIKEFDDGGVIKKKIKVNFYFAIGNNGELCISLPDKSKNRFQELTISLKKLLNQMNKQFYCNLEVCDLCEETAEAL